MDERLLQIIDANLNRTREGIRVCEDIARFYARDKNITASLKNIRHGVTMAMLRSKKIAPEKLLRMRNTDKDVMKYVDFRKQKDADIIDIFMSNIERVKESLRVLEECCKILDEDASRTYRRLRFNAYDVEKKIVEKIRYIPCNGQKGIKGA